MSKKGFTLIELLGAIAILAILTLIALPNVIKLFNKSLEETMKIQENQVLDAANLFRNDNCGRNAMSSEAKEACSKMINSNKVGESQVFVCLKTVQGKDDSFRDLDESVVKVKEYVGKVLAKGSVNCDGIVLYDYDDNLGSFSNGKTYLVCEGDTYQTAGYEEYGLQIESCSDYVEPVTYRITYNLNGGTANNPITYTSDDVITLNPPIKENHVFIGWTGSNGDTPQMNVTIPKGSTGDKEYTANYDNEEYTIIYNLNGGTANNPSTYTKEDEITLNNPTREGYTFTGWTGSNGTTPQMSVTILKGSTGNKEFIANYETENLTYTITYNLNGGTTINGNPSVYTKEDEITLNNPTKDGYSFTGWTGSNGDTPQKTVTIPKGSKGNKEYTANYGLSSYSITYNIENGTNNSNNKSNYTVETNSFNLYDPTANTGYVFTGWTGTGISSKTKSVTIPKGSTGNREYTAVICNTCNAGAHATCTLNESNCTYKTSCESGYKYKSGENAYNPICEMIPTFAFKYTGKFSVKDGTNSEKTYAANSSGTAVNVYFDDWYIKLLTNGVLTVTSYSKTTDIFLMGGGFNGNDGNGGWPYCAGGNGGKGGYYNNKFNITLKTSYNVVIGAATRNSTIKSTDLSVSNVDYSSQNTDNRRAGGKYASVNWDCKPVDATAGEDGAYPWSDTTFPSRYGGGGGGGAEYSPNGNGARGAGGAGGGARGCVPDSSCNAAANTGGGGGGGFGASDYKNYAASATGGTGGSGIIIIRRSRRITVTFNGNGGTIAKNGTQYFYHGKTGQKFADTGVTRSGYTLLGWGLSSSDTTARYGILSGVSDSWIDSRRPSVTLYAIWKKN